MITKVEKRDGRKVTFNIDKISHSIFKAAQAVGGTDFEMSELLAEKVAFYLDTQKFNNNIPSTQEIQNAVEYILIENEHSSTAKAYISNRYERTKQNEKNSDIINSINQIYKNSSNISPLNKLIEFGKVISNKYNLINELKPEYSKAHLNGDIYINNLDSLFLMPESFQIDLVKIFESNSSLLNINDYLNLTKKIIYSISKNVYTSQNITNFDYALSIALKKSYISIYTQNLSKAIEILTYENNSDDLANNIIKEIESSFNLHPCIDNSNEYFTKEREILLNKFYLKTTDEIQKFTSKHTLSELYILTYNSIKSFFSDISLILNKTYNISLNYGLDTSYEGKYIIKMLLTIIKNEKFNILPKQIIKIKENINYNKEDENYDLLKSIIDYNQNNNLFLFSFIDAKFNLPFFNQKDINTQIAYDSLGNKIISNIFDENNLTTINRGNLSTVSINLPRIALYSNKDINLFFDLLDEKISLCANLLLDILSFQLKESKNYLNNLLLKENNEFIKNWNLSINFVGLAETLMIFNGEHHGNNLSSQELGIKIVSFMREKINIISKNNSLNIMLLGNSNIKVQKYFISKDKEKFDIIKGINDKQYYTDSFKIPLNYNIDSFEKIKIESPYHELCNGGHLTTISLKVNTFDSKEIEEIIRCMKESNIGLGTINITQNNKKSNKHIEKEFYITNDIKLEINEDTSNENLNQPKSNNLDTEIENIINSQLNNKF